MFSDNKQLIGVHWLYDDLVESMKDFDASTFRYIDIDPYMYANEVREVLLSSEDFNDKDIQCELYKLLNMNRHEAYLYNDQAKAVHQYLMYNNVFTRNQWDKLCPMIKVFEFNADYDKFEKEITIHAESYIVRYANQIMRELNCGILSMSSVKDFDVMFEIFREDKKDNDDGIYFNVIYFLGTVIANFLKIWPDAGYTVQRRLSRYIAARVTSLNNPYWADVIF